VPAASAVVGMGLGAVRGHFASLLEIDRLCFVFAARSRGFALIWFAIAKWPGCGPEPVPGVAAGFGNRAVVAAAVGSVAAQPAR